MSAGFHIMRCIRGWSLDHTIERVQANHPHTTREDVERWESGEAVPGDAVAQRFSALWRCPVAFLQRVSDLPTLQSGDIHIKTSYKIACDAEGHTDYEESFDCEDDARSGGWLSIGDDLDFCPGCADRARRRGELIESARFVPPPVFNPSLLGLDTAQWGEGPGEPSKSKGGAGEVRQFPGPKVTR